MLKLAAVGLIEIGVAVGRYLSKNLGSLAVAQMGPSKRSGGHALWHLPEFGQQGCFI